MTARQIRKSHQHGQFYIILVGNFMKTHKLPSFCCSVVMLCDVSYFLKAVRLKVLDACRKSALVWLNDL